MEKMRAVVKVRAEPNGTEFSEVPVPDFGPNDVLIKINVISICGTDVHIFNWDDWAKNRIKPPLVYGHEFAGEVVKIGSNVRSVKVGDFVSGECHIACGHCFNCRTGLSHICQNMRIFGVDMDGAFGEYISIPESNVWHNDPSLPPELCSVQDPLGNAVHTTFSTDFVGREVAVVGIGPIGAMCVAILKTCGASKIFAIEKNNYRAKLAKEVGAHYVLNPVTDNIPEIVSNETGGKGVDVVLETAGTAGAVQLGLNILRLGGKISLLGVYPTPFEIDFSKDVVFKYATIQGINGRLMYETWYRMAGLYRIPEFRERISRIITHRYKFEQFFEAMEKMRSGECGKVVMYM
ncbi:MAG: L-threonine 3-dehydrogenase [Thermoplasmata archaeon]|nr:L-threonine 3-dehydrogenase [Thermoplasmata archaeon]